MGNIVTYSELGKNGRFANQILQITGTISYAIDNGLGVVFPKWEYSKWFKEELPEGYLPDAIKVPVSFHYAPITKHYGKDINLCYGHMQSWKYFFHNWHMMKDYLTLKEEHLHYIYLKYGGILQHKHTCAIHVRRTDYTTPTNLQYHGVMDMMYYDLAITELYEKKDLEHVHFIICSDDPQWCKDNFYLPNQTIVEGEENVIDLFLMSFCNNLIIANSSFSLCSAYFRRLNFPYSKSRVVAPKNWFIGKDAPQITKDIYCDDWIVI